MRQDKGRNLLFKDKELKCHKRRACGGGVWGWGRCGTDVGGMGWGGGVHLINCPGNVYPSSLNHQTWTACS